MNENKKWKLSEMLKWRWICMSVMGWVWDNNNEDDEGDQCKGGNGYCKDWVPHEVRPTSQGDLGPAYRLAPQSPGPSEGRSQEEGYPGWYSS